MENNIKVNRSCFVFLLIVFGITLTCCVINDNSYVTYHISSNGSDENTCGGSTDRACGTLEHVLYLYYNTQHPSGRGLEIITSKTITIDKHIMSIIPMLAETDVIISPNEKSSQPFTVFMDSLNFFNSSWQLFGVNIWMVKCDASSLTLEFINIINVTIENCTFGNWTFRQVQHVIIKNSRSSVSKDFPTLLRFYNSSGLIANINIMDLNFTNMFNGLIVQSNSYIQITKSKFLNNTVTFGLIKVLNSSTLEMRDCTLQKNKAIDYAGAINADKSFINLTNTSFSDNSAIWGGGALLVREGSFVFLKHCTFSYNQVELWYRAEKIEGHNGGAILLLNSTANGINVNFTGNKASYGGGLACYLHSQVRARYMSFIHNIAVFGSAIYGSISCKFLCKNCSLYENKNVAVNNDSNDILGAAINIGNHATINVSGFKCEKHTGYIWSCICAINNSSVFIYNAIFSMNIGSTIYLSSNSHLVAVSSSFLNNTASKDGSAIYSVNSILKISNCTFSKNSNAAMRLLANTTASLVNCIYESNSTPYIGGALTVNSATYGGAVYARYHSSLEILSCSFMRNTASNYKHIVKKGEGAVGAIIWIQMSALKIYESQFYNNFGEASGIVTSIESHLLICDSTFQNNTSTFYGNVMDIHKNSSLIIRNSSFMNNTVGGVLHFDTNSSGMISNVCLLESKPIVARVITAGDLSQIIIFNSSLVANKGLVISIEHDASLYMNYCVFFNNSERAVSVSSSGVVIIKNTEFSHNTGGAIIVSESTDVSFYNCSFNSNSAFEGGALYLVNSAVRLLGCNFIRNSATNGGVFWINGQLFVTDCIINNNIANGGGGVGNLQENSQINITTSVFRENSALTDGGVLWIKKGNASIWNSSFVQNNANLHGGVIYAKYSSHINISKTTFLRNKAGTLGGVITSTFGPRIFVSDSIMKQNAANICGMMVIGNFSVLDISFCQIRENDANFMAGALCVDNSSFISKSSVFKGNKINFGGSIGMIGNVDHFLAPSIVLVSSTGYMENCALIGNQGITVSTSELRLSKTVFSQKITQNGADIVIFYSTSKFINRIYTYKSLMKHGNVTLKSDTSNYKEIAVKEHFLQDLSGTNLVYLLTEETQFASIFPQPCLHKCTCYCSPWDRVNIFDCRNKGLTSLPETVLKDTDWLLLSGNILGSLNEAPDYLNNITFLDLSSSYITEIEETFMKVILRSVNHLNIRGNNLKEIPQIIARANKTSKLWISNNPYECNCDMMWMKDWLIDAGNVMDKDNVTCSGSGIKDFPIYKLDKSSLGCGFPSWAIITLVVGSTAVIIIAIILNRKWTTIKFHFYARFTNDDDSQDLSLMKYDAFVSYSQPDENFVQTEIIDFLEKREFKLCWHQRDFVPGTNIAENIADATECSRRIIFVISRTYADSEWCMTEFRVAHAHAIGNKRKKFLTPILCGDVTIGDLDTDLKFYLENHTFINYKNVDDMKKRLLKTMPHIPLLELRPELREQDETIGEDNAEDAENLETNTTFHNLEAEHTGAKYGLLQRVRKFISNRKANGRNIAAGGTGLVRADDDMRYGDDESSESDNEGDPHDGIPLVRRNKRK